MYSATSKSLAITIFLLIILILLPASTGSSPEKASPENRSTGPTELPEWSVGDKWVMVQTHFNPFYTSYETTTTYEIKNKTVWTTPHGTFHVFGVEYTRDGSHVITFENDDVKTTTFETTGTYFYRVSDLAYVATYWSEYMHIVDVGGNPAEAEVFTDYSAWYYNLENAWDYPINENESWSARFGMNYTYHTVSINAGGTYINDYGGNTSGGGMKCVARQMITVGGKTYDVFKVNVGGDSYVYYDAVMGWYVKWETFVDGELNEAHEIETTSFVHPPGVSAESFDFSMEEDKTDSSSVDLDDIFSGAGSLSYSFVPNENFTISIAGDGKVTFQPKKDWSGTNTVTFKANNGVKTSSKDLSVTVTPVNDPPVLDPFPEISFHEGGTSQELDLSVYATDVDNQPTDLSFQINDPTNFQAQLLGTKLTFSSPGDWTGSEQVEVSVKDPEGLSDTKSIKITVQGLNDGPILDPIGDQVVSQYEWLNFTLSATDIDQGSSLSFGTDLGEAIPNKEAGVDYDLDRDTGEFWFHPTDQKLIGQEPSKTYAVSFWVDDGELKGFSNITISIQNVNDPPEIFGSISASVSPDDNFNIHFSAPEVKDIDGDEISYTWDLGDGTENVKTANVDHTYESRGNYTVTLEITDGIIPEPLTLDLHISIKSEGTSTEDGSDGGDGGDISDGDDGEDGGDTTEDGTDGQDGSDGGENGDETDSEDGEDGDGSTGGGTNPPPGGSGSGDTSKSSGSGIAWWLIVLAAGFVIVFIIIILVVILIIASGKKESPPHAKKTDEGRIDINGIQYNPQVQASIGPAPDTISTSGNQYPCPPTESSGTYPIQDSNTMEHREKPRPPRPPASYVPRPPKTWSPTSLHEEENNHWGEVEDHNIY